MNPNTPLAFEHADLKTSELDFFFVIFLLTFLHARFCDFLLGFTEAQSSPHSCLLAVHTLPNKKWNLDEVNFHIEDLKVH